MEARGRRGGVLVAFIVAQFWVHRVGRPPGSVRSLSSSWRRCPRGWCLLRVRSGRTPSAERSACALPAGSSRSHQRGTEPSFGGPGGTDEEGRVSNKQHKQTRRQGQQRNMQQQHNKTSALDPAAVCHRDARPCYSCDGSGRLADFRSAATGDVRCMRSSGELLLPRCVSAASGVRESRQWRVARACVRTSMGVSSCIWCSHPCHSGGTDEASTILREG